MKKEIQCGDAAAEGEARIGRSSSEKAKLHGCCWRPMRMQKSSDATMFTVHAGEEEESTENSPAHGSTLHKIAVVRASCPTIGGGMVPVRRHCGGKEALSSPDDAIVLCRMEGEVPRD